MKDDALDKHLKTGSTTVCRAWLLVRKDGTKMGFTDHDCDLEFEDTAFKARSAFVAGALEKTNGMSVDNTEVVGALSDLSINEIDIAAGRYDGTKVTVYLVNWMDVSARSILFRGSFGEITHKDGAFRIELRGLSEALNVSGGKVFHAQCSAVLGDRRCRIDLSDSRYCVELPIDEIDQGRVFNLPAVTQFADGWFASGLLVVLSGRGEGQVGHIRSDTQKHGRREVELWSSINVSPQSGDSVRLVTGCDRRQSTCQQKFDNYLNFRGFPHIPGEDWLRSNPSQSRRR
jgi:uncharacterized phage protein (TIGR02218 family)